MKYLFLYAIAGLMLLTTCGGDDSKQEQTLTFDALAPRNLSEGSFSLSATASSGLPVSFSSSNTAIASVSGNTVTLHSNGTISITASQSGNDEYYEAKQVTRTLVVNKDNDPTKESQTITFNLNATLWKSSYGDLTLEATASSGLPVTYTVSRPDLVTVRDNILTLNEGIYTENITITASQAGNDRYNAAPSVTKNITVEHDSH